MSELCAKQIRVYGIVQGVGFRPFVSRIADRNRICGDVSNKGPYVEIHAQGSEASVKQFLDDLEHHPPERAVILKIDVEDTPEQIGKDSSFAIIESAKEEGEIFVSPDIAICEKCKQELFDKTNRRYLHPFINCTACGPRMTILDGMPYDRERTSMKEFPMCPECEYEYTHSETRRYDAQPVCCNDCGPQVYLLHTDGSQQLPVDVKKLPDSEKDHAAITRVRQVIHDGGIAAIKGIGGFHLCCDASNQEAVMRLRKLKHRPAKPFAVMMKDLKTVERECAVLPQQEEILDGHQKPIILLQKKGYYDVGKKAKHSEKVPSQTAEMTEAAGRVSGETAEASGERAGREYPVAPKLAPGVAPDNPTVGVMLPYAPVQLLLFTYDDGIEMPDCLVMTSGNISGAPICRDDTDAVRELSHLCDLILSHNRLIRLRADDTVMDFYKGEPYMIRRSRGYAPLPFMMEFPCSGTVLAIGGELKNTFCIGKHQLFYPSPYVGDMADIRTVRALQESVTRMEHLLEAEPELAVCDMHPKYNTVEVAESLGLPVMKIQHHYAHILSCMAENIHEDPVIGVSFDGTGYGTDQTIWGGEFLIAGYDGFRRSGSIDPFLQIGGDASSKEGWRIAVSMLYRGYGKDRNRTEEAVKRLQLCDEQNLRMQFMMADRKINSVMSTSAGRLFDAVSAVLGVRRESSFEGEASTTLMFAAERWRENQRRNGRKEELRELLSSWKTQADLWIRASEVMEDAAQRGYLQKQENAGRTKTPSPEHENEDSMFHIPTKTLFLDLADRRLAGEDADQLAFRFHYQLALLIAAGCRACRRETGIQTVALSGGVYQNRLLLEFSEELLKDEGFQVLRHHMIPPNDGGIALGQAAAGMWRLNRQKEKEGIGENPE